MLDLDTMKLKLSESQNLYEYVNSTDIQEIWETYKSINKISFNNPKEEINIITLLRVNNLNPFHKDCFIIPFNNSYTVVIAYQTLLRRAYEAGYDSKQLIFKEEKVTYPKHDYNNKIINIEDIQCTVTLTTSDNRSYTFTVLFAEYVKNNKIWKEKPIFMLRKCAVACLCRTLPNANLQSLPYIREELEV